MRVLKFGGSSLATPARIRTVTDIILTAVKEEPIIVVVSAFQGISNKLLSAAAMAADGNPHYEALRNEISETHLSAIQHLIPERNNDVIATCNLLLAELKNILLGIYQLKELTLGAKDVIGSFGEQLSAHIISAYINHRYPAQFVDARQFIITDDAHTTANVLFKSTNAAIAEYYEKNFQDQPVIPIVTGFIGKTKDGRTTTLGRNSSDYTATIIGAALNATRVEIWTDVDGVFSADPNVVSGAFIQPALSYLEAMELSHFGGKVIHALTLKPVVEKGIPILIKNTLNIEATGTYIVANTNTISKKQWNVKCVTSVDDISLIIWKNFKAADATHMNERLYRVFSSIQVQPLIHLEGSPNNHVHIAIRACDRDTVLKALLREFKLEVRHKMVAYEERQSQSIVAIVGDGMKELPPDSAGKMFQFLGKMDIQINAIVYGASERNICLIIDSAKQVRALNLIHQAFFSNHKNLAVIMIGVGRVGKALFQQLHSQQRDIHAKKIKLMFCAISNSKKMLTNLKGISLQHAEQDLSQSTEPFSIVSLLKLIPQIHCSNIALIDCTASQDIVDAYPLFIQEGVHIITPNKRANVLPYKQYQSLMNQFKRHQSQFLCRANVGAGLPVLYILNDLVNCGDNIIKIEGILTGTLSYVFNHYDGTKPFGQILKKAHELQLTEPDPREDLSGVDVARKLLILARYMGWKTELTDIQIENLVPTPLRQGEFSHDFFNALDQHEAGMQKRLQQCKSEGKVLRYVGTIHVESKRITAQLEAVIPTSPLAISSYSDNIISFTTHHYHTSPLVIQGPGAGVECTALGVYSDILELISRLP